MEISRNLLLLLTFAVLVQCRPWDWPFGSSTSNSKPSTPKPKLWSNETIFGVCEDEDKLIYIDDTRLESNDSQLSGVIEVYIDSPYTITCVKLVDQMQNRTGARVTGLAEGGQGHRFIKVNVQGQYGHGIHFKIYVWGNLIKEYAKRIVQ